MLLLGSRLINTPVMGLQTGSELARTKSPVIDPANLTILAYVVEGPLLGNSTNLLRIADTRELSDVGFIIDSSDEFVEPDDIIKLAEIYHLGFSLMNMPVTDERRRRLGKITDYTIDTDSFTVQQLTVKRPLFRRLSDTELLVHRSQIIEINNQSIVINSEAEIPEHTRLTAPGSYVNPFRKEKTIADSVVRHD